MTMKTPFILYSRMGLVTGRALKTALNIRGGRELSDPSDVSTLIRWGASGDPSIDEEVGSVVNTAGRVSHISNRHHMMSSLRAAAANVACLSGKVLAFSHELGYVLGGPTLFRHRYSRWGNDIIHYDENNFRHNGGMDGYFSVQYWPAQHEIRVHILNGKSICFQIKKQRGDDERPVDDEITVRNHRNGWGLYPLDNDEARSLGIQKRPLREAARAVVAELGLDFAAVDFLVRVPSFDYRVLELNTAPGLEGNTLEKYTNGLRAIIEGTSQTEDDGEGATTTPAAPAVATASASRPATFQDFFASPRPRRDQWLDVPNRTIRDNRGTPIVRRRTG